MFAMPAASRPEKAPESAAAHGKYEIRAAMWAGFFPGAVYLTSAWYMPALFSF
jgi:hypothetical protein